MYRVRHLTKMKLSFFHLQLTAKCELNRRNGLWRLQLLQMSGFSAERMEERREQSSRTVSGGSHAAMLVAAASAQTSSTLNSSTATPSVPGDSPSALPVVVPTSVDPLNNDGASHGRSKSKRAQCPRCDRPAPTACVCPALPESRLVLRRSHCLVLQHPHERKCKNRSLPFAEWCLDPSSITVIIGRRFSTTDPLAAALLRCDIGQPVWLLSPGEGAISLTKAIEEQKHRKQRITVIALDATWKVRLSILWSSSRNFNTYGTTSTFTIHQNNFAYTTRQFAREMDRANVEHNSYPEHMLRVQLTEQDFDGAFQPRRFDIRTPPTEQHLSTAECVAHVLSRIEDDDHRIYDAIMKPLDLMVRQWHSFSDHCKTVARGEKRPPTAPGDAGPDGNKRSRS